MIAFYPTCRAGFAWTTPSACGLTLGAKPLDAADSACFCLFCLLFTRLQAFSDMSHKGRQRDAQGMAPCEGQLGHGLGGVRAWFGHVRARSGACSGMVRARSGAVWFGHVRARSGACSGMIRARSGAGARFGHVRARSGACSGMVRARSGMFGQRLFWAHKRTRCAKACLQFFGAIVQLFGHVLHSQSAWSSFLCLQQCRDLNVLLVEHV